MNSTLQVRFVAAIFALLALLAPRLAAAPAVRVTLSAESTLLKVGESTVVHAFAEIAPDQRAASDQIFSWYVDLLNSDGAVAAVSPGSVLRLRSDGDPATSSSGTLQGPNLRGLYDTFLNLPAAGRDAPVELFSVVFRAVGPGKSTVRVAAGTGSDLGADFVVVPLDFVDPLLGGDYSAAVVEITGFNNTAPVLDVIPDVAVDEGTPIIFTAVGRDAETPKSLRYSITGKNPPLGASIDPVSGLFSWTPSEDQGPGSFLVTVQVADAGTPALVDFKSFKVVVREVNSAPSVRVPATQSVQELVNLKVTCFGTDADVLTGQNPSKNRVSLSLLDPPSGATIDPVTGVFDWTPSEAQGPGSYVITVVATDDGVPPKSGSNTFTVNVTEANLAPTLSAPKDQTIPELGAMTVAFVAADADAPANRLLFGLLEAPPGVALDPDTGIVTWTPTEAQGPGNYTIKVKATDNGSPSLSATNSFRVTVTEANSRPVLDPLADQTATERLPFSVKITAVDSDSPANRLVFSLENPPAGMQIDSSSGVLTWTATEDQGPGDYTVVVRVVDDGVPPLSDTKNFTVSVLESNSPPVLTVPSDRVVQELVPLSITLSATDSDIPANTVSFSLVDPPEGMSIDSASGKISWTPSEKQGPGSYLITAKATDNGSPALSDTKSFRVTVLDVNSPPILAPIRDRAMLEMTTITITNVATDLDFPPQKLTYSLLGAPAGVVINPDTGLITWTPTEAQGTAFYLLTVMVMDSGFLSALQIFSIVVVEANLPPVLILPPDPSVVHGNSLATKILATDPDLPVQKLTFALIDAPSGVALDPVTGALTWTPDSSQAAGSYPVTVKVTDDGPPPLSSTNTFTINVLEANTPPNLTVPDPQTVAEGTLMAVSASASDSDIPAQTLTFALVNAPEGVSINPATGLVSWVPNESQGPGDYLIKLKVTDSASPSTSSTNSFSVKVTEANLPPALVMPSGQTVVQGSPLSVPIQATDPDLPAQTLAFSLVSGPEGVAINASTGVLTWTPPVSQAPGPYQAVVKVSDGGSPSLSSTASLQITVTKKPGSDLPATFDVGGSTLTEAGFKLLVVGQAQSTYNIETSTDLQNWRRIGSVTLGAGSSAPFTDTGAAGKPSRFYRAVNAP